MDLKPSSPQGLRPVLMPRRCERCSRKQQTQKRFTQKSSATQSVLFTQPTKQSVVLVMFWVDSASLRRKIAKKKIVLGSQACLEQLCCSLGSLHKEVELLVPFRIRSTGLWDLEPKTSDVKATILRLW